ncbi:MAG: CoA ester lyase [Chloroflexi bacterium]|nr:CoA ester lyase [Chloroflexota bacterium]
MDWFRTLLFIPGNNPKMLEKGTKLPADALVPDLEDSVPPDEKANARAVVSEFLPRLAGNHVFVRINGLQTEWTFDDLKAIVSKHIEGISIGKMESADMAKELAGLLTGLERERGLPIGHTKIIPWIETGKGVNNVREIACATDRLVGLAFGAEDYTADMGVARTKGSEEIQTARAIVAIAARANDLIAYDTPDPDFNDIDSMVADARRAKAVGCKGKFVIHPNQIGPVNQVFKPTEAEVTHANRVIQAFEDAKKRGTAAVALDGKMVDTPVWKRAVKLVELSQAMERLEASKR